MSTAGAALLITDELTNTATTIMNQLANIIRTTFEQHLKESGHGFVKSHVNIIIRFLSSPRRVQESIQEILSKISHYLFLSSAMSVNGSCPRLLYKLENPSSSYANRS